MKLRKIYYAKRYKHALSTQDYIFLNSNFILSIEFMLLLSLF